MGVGRICDHQELQVLISGAGIPIDVSYLRSHANCSGLRRMEGCGEWVLGR